MRKAEGSSGKVFGIGLSRTGTKSLTVALRMLGLRAVHYPFGAFSARGGGIVLKPGYVARFDAITDTPAARFYRELDAAYPGSKFILTLRGEESWLKSIRDHLRVRKTFEWIPKVRLLDREIYGADGFDEALFRSAYRRHKAEVLAYFADRPRDLLTLDVCGGEGFEKLAPFLGRRPPVRPFPRRNPGYRTLLVETAWTLAGAAGLRRPS